MRPRSPLWVATWALQPQTMSSTSAVLMPVRSASARSTVAPSCCGWMPDNAPLPALPTPRGVLQASMISASAMGVFLYFVVGDISAKLAEEVAHFRDEEIRLLECREMAALRHLAPMGDVGIARLHPLAHRRHDFLGEHRNAGRYFYG